MKNLDLTTLGVDEMNEMEMKKIDGGCCGCSVVGIVGGVIGIVGGVIGGIGGVIGGIAGAIGGAVGGCCRPPHHHC